MSELEYNAIFARNLAKYLSERGMLQVDLAKRLGVSESTVSRWLDGQKAPRMNNIDQICAILNVSRMDLLADHDTTEYKGYYTKTETHRIAQEIYEDRDLRLLFDAAKDAAPEDLQAVHAMLKALKAKEQGNED